MSRGRGKQRSASGRHHRPAADFAGALGYRFRQVRRLEEALTHGSYRNDHEVADYERLEFLGDAALGLAVTEIMHHEQPGWSGEDRQEAKSALVSNESLAGAAQALALDEGIRVGRGVADKDKKDGDRFSKRILANVFEAVLGAAYLDGGMPAVRAIVGAAFRRELRQEGLRLAPPEPTPGRLSRTLFRLRTLPKYIGRFVFLGSRTERALGYTFARPDLLRVALDADRRRPSRKASSPEPPEPPTHPEPPTQPALRFLGRDVTHLVVAHALHTAFPQWDEGRLTLARMRLQEREFTSRLSRHWALGDGETAAADAEAVMGALYLDGRLAAARRALRKPLRDAIESLRDPDLELLDPKTLLQNTLAKAGREAPSYAVRRAGNDSPDGEVSVTVRIEGGIVETASGSGIKEAEKNAARLALAHLDDGGAPEPEPAQQRARPAPSMSAGRRSRRAAAKLPDKAGIRPDNPKGALQEALVKREGRLPVYRVISESGPEHEKVFVVEVAVGRKRLGRGSGRNKRAAEAEAAAAALAAGHGI